MGEAKSNRLFGCKLLTANALGSAMTLSTLRNYFHWNKKPRPAVEVKSATNRTGDENKRKGGGEGAR